MTEENKMYDLKPFDDYLKELEKGAPVKAFIDRKKEISKMMIHSGDLLKNKDEDQETFMKDMTAFIKTLIAYAATYDITCSKRIERFMTTVDDVELTQFRVSDWTVEDTLLKIPYAIFQADLLSYETRMQNAGARRIVDHLLITIINLLSAKEITLEK